MMAEWNGGSHDASATHEKNPDAKGHKLQSQTWGCSSFAEGHRSLAVLELRF